MNAQISCYGQKSGVPIQKENEAPLGPEAKEEENGEEYGRASWVLRAGSGAAAPEPRPKMVLL